MKNAPFILLFLGITFIWLGLTGRLGAVLAALFEPGALIANGGGGADIPPVVMPPDVILDGEPTVPETLPDIPNPFDIFPGADVLPAV